MGLRSHDHERVRHGLFDGGGGEVPQDRPVAAVMGQELVEHFLRGNERDPAKRPHHRDHLGVPLVFAIGDSDPIDRISKDSPHCEAGRLGNP